MRVPTPRERERELVWSDNIRRSLGSDCFANPDSRWLSNSIRGILINVVTVQDVDQLNSVDGETRILPKSSVGQFGLTKIAWLTERN